MSCQHEDFEARCEVSRVTPDEGTEVVAFTLDVRVHCVACGEPFGFRGMAPGLSWGEPTRSADAQEARLPLLTPSELALNGPLPGLFADPDAPPMPGLRISVR